MGDDQHRPARNQLAHCTLDQGFVFWVNVGGGFVKNDNRSILQHGAGDGNALPLPAGQMGAAPSHDGVIALLQGTDEIVAPGSFGHGFHLLVGSGGTPHSDVLPHALVKEVVVLGHEGHLVIELGEGNAIQILPAQGDGAGGYIPEPGDQLGDGGLAGAGRAHKGGHGAGGDGEVHVVEDLLVHVVAEGHMGEGNVPPTKLYGGVPMILLLTVQNLIH